jgi:hypothetical protein
MKDPNINISIIIYAYIEKTYFQQWDYQRSLGKEGKRMKERQ